MPKVKHQESVVVSERLLDVLLVLNPFLAKELRSKDATTVVGYIGLLTYLALGETNLSDLANYQGVSLPTMSATISTLVERGWVSREHSSADRRMIMLRVAPKGHAVLQTIRQQVVDSLSTFLNLLSAEELETLDAGLAILLRSLLSSQDSPT